MTIGRNAVIVIQVPPKSFSNNISYCKFLNIFGAFLHDSCMFLSTKCSKIQNE